MADSNQNFVENNEEQEFLMQQSEFDQQNIVGNFPEEYHFGGNESGNQTLEVNEEAENNYGVLSDQVFADNQNPHAFDGDEGIHGLDGDELKQELTNNESVEGGNAENNSKIDKKEGNENSSAGVGADKKWPGYPGESVFRMLVPTQKVGNIIGRKGEYIKKIVEETRARIKVMDGPPGSQVRAVMVSAREDPDATLPPAMNGLLSVHKRVVDGLDSESQGPPGGGKVSTRLLVPATQAGSLIGKQGATVKSIQESAGCIVRVLGQDDLPVFALQEDRVVEVVGEAVNVHKAVELIASHLRKFLVDRSIIPIFEKQMQAPAKPMEHMPPQPWGPPHHHPQSGGGGYNMGYMAPPPPRQLDNYYPPAEMVAPPDNRQPHQGISAYGREPLVGVHATSNPQPAPAMITQITQHMQVPLIYADSVIGANGATVSYIRRASGATVTIQETRGVPGEMTVEINGTASQVQTAQQLIQNYMAEAAAAAAGGATTAATQTGGATDQGGYSQGYNSYAAAPAPVYGTTPASAAHPTQPGAYGSVYGASYGY